ncbi:hypothetical protein BJ508DRAFT_45567 [Ascobolus immersus RN42]|uniref:Uncharacterized protein n=1 Tax=Ascobolus immersus RN42 TaxID=1160509 RepID=A0A3N4HIH5_ASCIM|nr:hypothetical protein BJ508DRAFT_45567 [Ascobolus immersus RN42]
MLPDVYGQLIASINTKGEVEDFAPGAAGPLFSIIWGRSIVLTGQRSGVHTPAMQGRSCDCQVGGLDLGRPLQYLCIIGDGLIIRTYSLIPSRSRLWKKRQVGLYFVLQTSSKWTSIISTSPSPLLPNQQPLQGSTALTRVRRVATTSTRVVQLPVSFGRA